MGTRTARTRRPRAASIARPAPDLGERPESTPTTGLPRVLAAALVFLASGAVLVLEILSVRLLAPYVGLTLETTTSIIGAVLAGIALGAALGGRLADRINPRWLLVALFVLGGLLVLLTVPIIRALGPSASEGGNAAAIGVTFAALVPLAAVLSGITPTVARLQLRDLRASGTVVGGLSAWATAGALAGTFGTGFVLVPLFPVSATVTAIGIALVLVGGALGLYLRALGKTALVATAIVFFGVVALAAAQHSPCEAESGYHCIQVEEDPSGRNAKILLLDRGLNSDVDVSEPSYLGFPYERWLAETIEAMGAPRAPLNGVFVGGGAFTMPRWLNAVRPGSRSTVLEVDGKLVDFDREHLGLRTSPGLRAVVGDARLSIRRQPTHSADVIVGDAFSSRTVPWQLMTTEWLKEVKRVLKPGGIYLLNMIDYPPLALFRAESATLLAAFAHVRLTTLIGEGGKLLGGTEVLAASSAPLPAVRHAPGNEGHVLGRAAVVRLVAGAQRLRDDYAPVDQLETR
ncbi:MAG TPA: fused MFS/spermidine synthase [Solirubrobacteraceae bacterium]|nr:fused MFS/spermidine synthase [Solirubrobacteraceae bacterium]